MLFESLMKDKKNNLHGLCIAHDLWAFGEIIRTECNSKSIDVYNKDLYLDDIDGKNSIYMEFDSYETKVKFIDAEYTGLLLKIKYPNKNIYNRYSKKLENRILTLKYNRSNKYKYVPFGFDEAKIVHVLNGKSKIVKVTQKTEFSSARRTIISNEIDD